MMPARSSDGSHRSRVAEELKAKPQDGKRPKACHAPSLKWGPVLPRKDRDDGPRTSEDNYAQAARNASEYEFDRIRVDMEELVQRSMSAAEAGVRLCAFLQQHPDVLSSHDGSISPQLEGVGIMPRERAIPKRELLPLPFPKRSLIRESDILSMLKSDGQIGSQARQA